MKTTLITGASAGIGKSLAEWCARRGDKLVLVARDQARLQQMSQQLQQQFGIACEVLPCDLARAEAASELMQQLQQRQLQIDLLINNAGMGVCGAFIENDFTAEQHQLHLNVTTPTLLCQLMGRQMAQRGGGEILNIASTAAYQSGPFMAGYYASKAYLLSLSIALHHELKKRKVKVTALCPGPVQTEFFDRADMNSVRLSKSPMMMQPDEVAQIAMQGLAKNKSHVIAGKGNWVLAQSIRLASRDLAAWIASMLNRGVQV